MAVDREQVLAIDAGMGGLSAAIRLQHAGYEVEIFESDGVASSGKDTEMKTWIVLLRGVMPSGRNKVPMAQLRASLAQAGFERVRSWIQSGNVLVDTALERQQIHDKVIKLLHEELGVDLAVMVKRPEELEAVLEDNPFADLDPERVFYGFFNRPPEADTILDLMSQDFGEERLAITDRAVYMFIPGSAARSKLNNAFLQRKLGIELSFRNRNTLAKLCSMAEET